ncbi:Flp pilus assembly protein CpaB [Shewanella sp. PP-He15 brown]
MSFQKSKSSWLMLTIAVLVAIAAFWLSNNYLKNKEEILKNQIIQEEADTVSVVVASRPVQIGEIISSDNMAVADMPAAFASASAVAPGDFDYYNGQVVKHDMSPGEPLLTHYVSGLGIESFSDLLGEGERAVTLQIDEINSVSGMTLPGDIVDLMLVTEVEPEGESTDKITQIQPLLQSVRILAVDDISLVSPTQDFVLHGVGKGSLEYSSITVGVKYQDAAKLVLAKEVGEIAFMLRNRSDEQRLAKTMFDSKQLASEVNSEGQYQLYTLSSTSGGGLKPVTVSIASPSTKTGELSLLKYNASSQAVKN